jgi:mono/diheme cytochrome c family protein
VYAYRQTALSRAALGGVYYRGNRYPSLLEHYIFGDNQAGTLMAFDPDAPDSVATIARAKQFGQLGPTSITTSAGGEIYVTVLGSKQRRSGEILRLALEGGEPLEPPAPATPNDASLAISVETKYASVCSRCHGVDGKGEPEIQGTPRPNFTSTAWQAKVSDEYIKRVVALGGAAFGRSPEMPAWGTLFGPRELELLVRKIRRFGALGSSVPARGQPPERAATNRPRGT